MKDATKSALYTALWSFLGVFGVSLLGWLGDIATWAGTDGATFPAVTPLGKAAVAAFAAAASGLIGWLVRTAQSRGMLPGSAPHYTSKRK